MTAVEFRNESEVNIPAELRRRLSSAAQQISADLRETGHTQESMKEAVILLLLRPGDGPLSTAIAVVRKVELREALAGLASQFAEDTSPPELPRESLIQRCLAPSPHNAVRILWLAHGYNGTMQIHFDESSASLLADTNSRRYASDEKVKDVTDQLVKILKPYPKKQAKAILEEIYQANEELLELRNAISKDEEEAERVDQELAKLLPTFKGRYEDVVRRSRKVPLPPTTNTAGNIEALVMAATYVFEPVFSFSVEVVSKERASELVSRLIGYYSLKEPSVRKILQKMDDSLRGRPFATDLQEFGIEWMKQGFPKLEIGHKLAATLAMTDVPDDIEVMAPWKAWSLVIPPGLFGGADIYSRMWMLGTEILFLVGSDGEIQGPLNKDTFSVLLADKEVQGEPQAVAFIHAMRSLVKGACLALSNPDEYKRQSFKDKSASTKKPKRENEVPDFSVSRFMLSAPVQIDVRQHLLDYINGRKTTGGSGPKVQFFVRGHWRNQAHGPRLSLRKQMRIEGYWKGPEHGAIKLGNYKVKDEEDDKPKKDET